MLVGKKNSEVRRARAIESAVFLLAGVVLCASLLVAYLRLNARALFGISPAFFPTCSDALKWFEAVSSGEEKLAALLAARLAYDDFRHPPPPDYMDIARISGMGAAVLTGPFGETDARRWQAAFEAAKIARSISEKSPGPDGFAAGLLDFLQSRFEISTDESLRKNEGYLSEIMRHRKVTFEALLRIASEIAFQGGFAPVVVTVHDEDQGALAAFMELRKGGRKFILSPSDGKLWADMSVEKFIKSQDRSPVPGFPDGAKFARYHLSAEPSDFKEANRLLRQEIAKLAPDLDLPLFGIPPLLRIRKEIDFRASEAVEPAMFAYWRYPFLAMRADENVPAVFKLARQLMPPRTAESP